MSESVQYWNRRTGQLEKEAIFGERFLRFAYEGPVGRFLFRNLFIRRPFSQAYGAYQSTSLSASAIDGFIQRYRIPMDEFEERRFASFNDFFVRRFKPGARNFAASPDALPAFAEGRYLAFARLDENTTFPIKEMVLTAETLLGKELAGPFRGGPAFIARLCPTDYHRFHFPDDGEVLQRRQVPGQLHSVAVLALRHQPDVLVTNERQIDILQTVHFGRLAYVAVGAMCVGRIVDTQPGIRTFRRGDEKGYFLFGGSTVVLVGEPGAWTPDADLLAKTTEGIETLIRLGDRIGGQSTFSTKR